MGSRKTRIAAEGALGRRRSTENSAVVTQGHTTVRAALEPLLDAPMTRFEVVLAWHRVHFELEWLRASGMEFQTFFERCMAKVEPDFIAVSPAGREGDWKSDGYVPSKKHHFQVYAPPTGIDSNATCAKIKDDFAGICEHWPDMLAWTFVWSTPRGGLPPQVVLLLNALDDANSDIAVDQWGLEPFWQQVRALDEQDRLDLLGHVPGPEDITGIESDDIRSMLTTLAERPLPTPSDIDFSLLEVGAKMERNGLGDGVRMLLTASYGLTPDVRKYLAGHPDPRFPDRVGDALKDLYREAEPTLGANSDALFGAMVQAVATPDGPTAKRYWAAAAIVGYSFELCDIFHR